MAGGNKALRAEDGVPFTPELASSYSKLAHEAKKRNRREKMTINHILAMSIKEGEPIAPKEIQSLAEVAGMNISVEMAMYLAQVKQAVNGNTRAWQALMEYTDRKERRALEIEQLSLEVEKMKLEIDALKREREEAENVETVQVVIDV